MGLFEFASSPAQRKAAFDLVRDNGMERCRAMARAAEYGFDCAGPSVEAQARREVIAILRGELKAG